MEAAIKVVVSIQNTYFILLQHLGMLKLEVAPICIENVSDFRFYQCVSKFILLCEERTLAIYAEVDLAHKDLSQIVMGFGPMKDCVLSNLSLEYVNGFQ